MGTYEGSTFKEVRDLVFSDPYDTFPNKRANIFSMFKGFTNLLWQDSETILSERADIVPHVDKLLHLTGISLTGTWKITEDNEYTGLFKKGTEALILVRCSSLLGRSRRTRSIRRGFAIAGKIFPTMDPEERVGTANFITIDALGGTRARKFTDVALTNEPALGVNLTLLGFIGAVFNVLIVFNLTDSDALHRPLYPLGEEGLAEGEVANTPYWLQLSHAEGNGSSDASDLRNELNVENYKDGILRFVISVAPYDEKGNRVFKPIGEIALNESVVSAAGDHRIRFYHQPNRRRETT